MTSFIIYSTLGLIFVIIQHSNTKFPDWIENYGRYVFSTPGWHKIHHSDDQIFTDSVFYALVGGRVFCSWVCPVNVATDSASWLRRRFNITSGRAPKDMRFWLIPAVLGASAISGVAVWEWVNPVSLTQRALIFGGSSAPGAVGAVFLFDLLVAPRGWCGHVCPVGATYALIGHKSLLRVSAQRSSACNDCADCYAVCPEPQIIPKALKGKGGVSPVILDAACTNCGRCIDVCGPDVFSYTSRFNHKRV